MNAGVSRAWRWWTQLAVVGILLVAAAFWAGTRVNSRAALKELLKAPPKTVITAPVVMRRLSATLTVGGAVRPSGTFKVNFGPVTVAHAQPIVTVRPRRAGTLVRDGTMLAEVAGRPVFAFRGLTPMYRDLMLGDQGRDVLQLQDGLAAAGFVSMDAAGVFGPGTASAVRDFYRAADYTPPEASAGATPSTAAAKSTGPAIMVPQAEIVFLPTLPAMVESTSLALGQPVSNPAMVLGTGRLRAVLPLTTAQAALVKTGDRVKLYIRTASGSPAEFGGRVKAVRPASARSGGAAASEGTQSLTALVSFHTRLSRRLAGDAVTAVIVVTATPGPVLAVPAAALYSAPNGQTTVTVVAHGRRVAVPVRAGSLIGGYVPVRPLHGRLTSGERVLVGE